MKEGERKGEGGMWRAVATTQIGYLKCAKTASHNISTARLEEQGKEGGKVKNPRTMEACYPGAGAVHLLFIRSALRRGVGIRRDE